MCRQYLCYTHQDGRVGIVSAGMHHAGLLPVKGGGDGGFEGKVYTLGHREGIHIGTKGHHRSKLASSKYADYPSDGYIFGHFHTKGAEVSSDDFGGANLLITQFGMLVKIPSPFDDFGFYALSFLVNAGTKLGLTEGSSCYKE